MRNLIFRKLCAARQCWIAGTSHLKPVLTLVSMIRCTENDVAYATSIRSTTPVAMPIPRNANGTDRHPAPSVAEHKLKMLPLRDLFGI
jgi:hypothetical protein